MLHEPWYLFIPFGAALLSSSLLFGIAWGHPAAAGPGKRLGFLQTYRSFLGLFCMTAPLAWLYAIPYERFLTPVEAVQANLWTLGLVAVWRVALMIRVLIVLLHYHFGDAFLVVITFACGVILLVFGFLPFPIIEVMGGVRMSEADMILKHTTQTVFLIVCLVGPSCFLITLATLPIFRDRTAQYHLPPVSINRVSLPLWVLALGAVGIWGFVLPFTQPEQQLRWGVEQEFREERYGSMLTVMSSHSLEEFPPHWQPPPRWPRDGQDKLVDIWEEIAERPPAEWVRRMYLNKLRDLLHWHHIWRLDTERIRLLLARLPEGHWSDSRTGSGTTSQLRSIAPFILIQSQLRERNPTRKGKNEQPVPRNVGNISIGR